jgi:hypothetical protein
MADDLYMYLANKPFGALAGRGWKEDLEWLQQKYGDLLQRMAYSQSFKKKYPDLLDEWTLNDERCGYGELIDECARAIEYFKTRIPKPTQLKLF